MQIYIYVVYLSILVNNQMCISIRKIVVVHADIYIYVVIYVYS